MADEKRIMEMMEEMESYFEERDSLFQNREEAYEKRYQDLVRRESLISEKEEELERLQKEHQSRMDQLREKEQEVLLKAAGLKEKTDSREEEYRRIRRKLQEDQLRLNLFETKLQNESLKAQTSRLRFESEKAESGKSQMPVLPCCIDVELPGQPTYHTLEEENEKLKNEVSGLHKELLEETRKRETVEKEKKELLKRLLQTDPEFPWSKGTKKEDEREAAPDFLNGGSGTQEREGGRVRP